jgi:predicted metal-dependent HD superfamily phosphohydrolase
MAVIEREAGAARFVALWRRFHAAPGAGDAASIYDEVVRRYAEPQRRYHTLDHVGDCLQRFDRIRDRLDDPDAVELAIWFHDVIYDLGARNNERRSAEFYAARAAGAELVRCRRVCSLILITRHCQAARGNDRAYMVDIDLAGFGLPWDEFQRQSDLVRGEFPDLDEAQYRAGQLPFFRRLLARRRFFCTDDFYVALESRARANVARTVAEWTVGDSSAASA